MFEGYVGIHLWSEQQIDDLLFGILLTSFMLFALFFRSNPALFFRLLKDAWAVKRRSSLFESPTRENPFFQTFLLLQPILLGSVILFTLLQRWGYSHAGQIHEVTVELGLLCFALSLFFCIQQIIYTTLGNLFADPERYHWWKTGYYAILSLWGVSLYLPAIWLVFVGTSYQIPFLLFVTLYILCRFAIIYKIIRIFYTRNKGLFYISLYLCAQEILPLFFLYKGIIYLYNFIG